MKKSDLQEEKVRIISSLGSVKDPQLIQEVLELSMSADIRSQDMDTCVAGCLGTTKGVKLNPYTIRVAYYEHSFIMN